MNWMSPVGQVRGKSPNFPEYTDTKTPAFKPKKERTQWRDWPEMQYTLHMANAVEPQCNGFLRSLRQSAAYAEHFDKDFAEELMSLHQTVVEGWEYLLQLQEEHFKPLYSKLVNKYKPEVAKRENKGGRPRKKGKK